MKLAVERSTTKVLGLVGALAVLGTLLFAASALAAGKEGARGATGATGPTGPAGANGTNGEKGANGSNGSGGGSEKNGAACEKGTPVATCTLASGYQETGTWSVHIAVPTGAPQQQYESPISFPVRLKIGAPIKATYVPAAQEFPKPPCNGSPLEPMAAPGNLCVYRGNANRGGLESQDQNAAFFGILNTNGENTALEERVGPLGALVVFRSKNNSSAFKEETPVAGEAKFSTITEAAYMEGGGSWAVTEK